MPDDKLIEAIAFELEPFGHMIVAEQAIAAAREDAERALTAIEQAGYVVVPMEPDKRMIDKGLDAIRNNMDSTRDSYGSWDYAVEGTAYHCYVAMLAATKENNDG